MESGERVRGDSMFAFGHIQEKAGVVKRFTSLTFRGLPSAGSQFGLNIQGPKYGDDAIQLLCHRSFYPFNCLHDMLSIDVDYYGVSHPFGGFSNWSKKYERGGEFNVLLV